MKFNSLDEIIENLADISVLVVGDTMLDRFVYGQVDRISPESPVPVLAIQNENRMLGGAGNALSNLAGLGAKGKIVSIVGDDDDAENIRAAIKNLGFGDQNLVTDAARPTIVKTRFLAGHQQLLRTDYERKEAVSDDVAQAVLKAVNAAIKDVNAVIISDYGKGMLRDDVLQGIIETAKAAGIPVIVDPKGQDFSKYKGASAITPNKKELQDATKGHAVSSDDDVVNAAKMIIEDCGIDAVVATRSADGMSVITKSEDPVHMRSADIEVFDVSGAGDTVIATIAACLGAGAELSQAASIANIAGQIVVTKVGTAPIRRAELLSAIRNEDDAGRAKERMGDILGWDEAAETIRRWQARGLKVGFTNGCFDIVHYGHVSYLNNTRDHCDRLIVGLNKDSSVKVLKGEERPVHDEHSRASVLAALGSVDMVVLFGAEKGGDDNTACALIETLKPDVYFKGGDYTVDQIPEAPTVQSYGGVVNVMPVYDGHSTTGSIAKMKSGT